MESLILLLLALVFKPANAQLTFEGIDPDLIVNPPEGLDLEGCFSDLIKSDIDGSGAIEKDEYLNFINTYGERICWYQEELTLEQHGAFNSLACLCRSQEGNDASCCLRDNAKLPTTNAVNPQARTEEELLFLTVACVVTDGTLQHLCKPPDDSLRKPLDDSSPTSAPASDNVEGVYYKVVLQSSDNWSESRNITKYYCMMRGLWSPQNHPVDFPFPAYMTNPFLYSATDGYNPWLLNKQTTWGIEKIAETGFTDIFRDEIAAAGSLILDTAEGEGFSVGGPDPKNNYAFLPAVTVNGDYHYLAGIAGMQPSPDWFTGFYLLDVIDHDNRTFWERIIVRTYPIDAGTDAGTTYTGLDKDIDPPLRVQRINKSNAPASGIFLDPDGKQVRPVAEWDCMLHVCPVENKDCEMEKWPPANNCDVLKWPGCDVKCNPDLDRCQQCKPKSENGNETVVFYKNCCQSNHEPLQGSCTLPDRLPFCELHSDAFEDDQGAILDVVLACFNKYPSCFDLDKQGEDLLRCFTNAQFDPTSNGAECFVPIAECVESLGPGDITDSFTELPSCVLESGLALTQCFLDNRDTCISSCLSTDWPFPLQDLDPSTLTCANARDNIVDPLCQAVACCEPCVEFANDLSSCLLSDVLKLPCDSGCSKEGGSSQRHLESHVVQNENAVKPYSTPRDLAKEYSCNICGCNNCTFANDAGVVEFFYNYTLEKRPCRQLQEEVENPEIYNTAYCHEVIWRVAYRPCLCFNENFPTTLLDEIPGYADRQYGNSGTLEEDKEDADGNAEDIDKVEDNNNEADNGAGEGEDVSGADDHNEENDGTDLQGAMTIFSTCLGSFAGDNAGWIQFVNCVVQEVISAYKEAGMDMENETTNSTFTGTPTGTPTLSPPTFHPTSSATTLPTSSPKASAQTFEFPGLFMRLEGGKQLTAESRVAFEAAAEEFYRHVFLRNTNGGVERRLQEIGFSSFDTDVTAKSESLDATGNTITYDQSVTFVASAGLIDKETTRELLSEPLEDKKQEEEFIQLLQENDSDFASVTDAEIQLSKNVSDNDDSMDGSFITIIVVAGGLVCCCCCAGYAVYKCNSRELKRHNSENPRDGDPDVEKDYMVPEGPLRRSLGDDAFIDDGYNSDNKSNANRNDGGFGQDFGSGSDNSRSSSEYSGGGSENSGSNQDNEASDESSGGSFI